MKLVEITNQFLECIIFFSQEKHIYASHFLRIHLVTLYFYMQLMLCSCAHSKVMNLIIQA